MNYPNCYSPNLAAHAQQYGQYSQLMMGTNGGGGGPAGGTNPGSNPAQDSFSGVATATAASSQAATGQRGSANQSPITSTKFPGSSGGAERVGGSPPQDLSGRSTSDGEGGPVCQSTTSGLGGMPKTPETPGAPMSPLVTSSPGSGSKDASSTGDRGSGGASNSCNNNSSGSKNSKTSDSGSADGDGKSSTNNPPQIYPWMKRVHLGQSKLFGNRVQISSSLSE